ncbi:DUF7544 domain-containing protein [Holophaga foetida]|uniref:DUF7544 domain-containing protein n=1 Tax=Holophaga foetida TaxID=35839 RepID=UPI0002473F17|nr:hypothetical protein [Holophaga foetida]
MPSVSRSVSAAYDHMARILFTPFDMGKWFILGFCAFLSQLGGGFGGLTNIPTNLGSPSSSGNAPFSEALPWIQEHLILVIVLAVLIVLVISAIGLLLAWIAVRGEFMFLDGIVQNRGEIAEPWTRFRKPANRLLLYRINVAVAGMVFLMVMVGIGTLLVLPMIRQGASDEIWKPLLLLALPTGLGLFAFGVYLMVLRDFGVPIMFRAEVGPREAMGLFRTELLPGNGGAFVLFYLMKLLLGIAAGVLIVMAGCLTCCIGFLPYLSSVLTLPVTVFFRCYALDLMAQVDPKWDLFSGQNGAEPGDTAPVS